jgi:hypothetical protein
MTFEEAKTVAVADLREVARLTGVEADEIEKGDLGRMDTFIEKLSEWRDMLLLRHAHRMEQLEEARAATPAIT